MQTTSNTQTATNRLLDLPPALLEEIRDNPEVLASLHRVQRAVLSHRAVRLMMDSEKASPQQFAVLIDALRKAEKDDMPERGGAAVNGFHFSITLPASGQTFLVDTRAKEKVVDGEVLEP